MASTVRPIEIEADDPAEWDKFRQHRIDVVPDPMLLRTAELFLNGQSGAVAAGLQAEEVWTAIDKNLHGLLCFFDTLLTRDRLPLIQYWETFARPQMPIQDLLGSIAVPVIIGHDVYESAKRNLVSKLVEPNEGGDLPLEQLPPALIEDVTQELGAFAYDWHPALPGLEGTAPDRFRVAEFLVGGMVFGSYAQATGGDHLVQPKRSRLLLAISAPRDHMTQWGYHQEQQLFADFKQHCVQTGTNIRAEDFGAAPTVLPYLLGSKDWKSEPRGVEDLLARCLELRGKSLGEDYREWFRSLRRSWAHGTHDEEAERSAAVVLRRLQERVGAQGIDDNGGVRLSMGVQATLPGSPIGGQLAVENVRLAVPRWLRLWVVDHFTLRPHRRLLLRMSLTQRLYDDVTLHLRQLWGRS